MISEWDLSYLFHDRPFLQEKQSVIRQIIISTIDLDVAVVGYSYNANVNVTGFICYDK